MKYMADIHILMYLFELYADLPLGGAVGFLHVIPLL